MKKTMKFFRILAVAVCLFLAGVADASTKTVAFTSSNDGEWTTTITVNRGHTYTFWLTGCNSDMLAMLNVDGTYTYKEDGDTWEDFVVPSVYMEVANSLGGTDVYVGLTEDDWEWVPTSVKSVKFNVTVIGFYDAEYPQNNKCTLNYSEGYLVPDEPVKQPKEGTSEKPKSITIKDVEDPVNNPTETSCTPPDEDYEGVYYLKTSNLIAGHKYFIGTTAGLIVNVSDKIDGTSILKEEDAWDGWADVCANAWAFVPSKSGAYYIQVENATGEPFDFFHAALPARTPAQHESTPIGVGDVSEEFKPGYAIDPEGTAYDQIIDQELFEVTNLVKGCSYVFRTEGANVALIMRVYDAKGTVLAENIGTSDDVMCAWTAPSGYTAKNNSVYVGVCQNLEKDEVPTSGTVTLSVKRVVPERTVENLTVIPDASSVSPELAADVRPSSPVSLSETVWTNAFVIAARAGVTYRMKAAAANMQGLKLGTRVYTLNGTKATLLTAAKEKLSGSLSPEDEGYLEFTPQVHGAVYVDVFVADGEWGNGTAREYGPYQVYATAVGAELGILTVEMKGAAEKDMQWKLLKKDGLALTKPAEIFYPAGASAILEAGTYTVLPQTVKNFAAPDKNGFEVKVVAGSEPSVVTYKYTDTSDPKDDLPVGKLADGKTAATPTKLSPTAKGTEYARSLWDDDSADWYTFTGAEGAYYKFLLREKSGDAVIDVFGPDTVTNVLENVINTNQNAVQVSVPRKGTYYVRVAHADAEKPEDSSYSMFVTTATPGQIKVEKNILSVKEDAPYVDVNVTRSGKDGVVRLKYRTEAMTAVPREDYYPTNGVITWVSGDQAKKTVRVKLIPDLIARLEGDKQFRVVFETFSPEDETFDRENEFEPTFAVDSKLKEPIDSCVVTLTETAKAVPGTIAVDGVADVKKPVITVSAGSESVDVPFVRTTGADGAVAVRIETVKGTANAKGETEYATTVATNIWQEGESFAQTVTVPLKQWEETDYTAVKTFTLKLTALTSAKTDEVQYVKPSFAAASVTVNIVNDKFAKTGADFIKAMPKTCGYTIKEVKAGTWFVGADGTWFTKDGEMQKLTLSVTGPGTFSYVVDGETVTVDLVDPKTGKSVTKSITIEGSRISDFTLLDDSRAFGSAIGTFTGLARTYDATNNVASLALVTITADAKGKQSAKVQIAGKTYQFSGTGYESKIGEFGNADDPAMMTAYLVSPQKITEGKITRTVTNELFYTVGDYEETDPTGWAKSGKFEVRFAALPDAAGTGYQEDIWYEGELCRDNGKVTAWVSAAAKFAGYYTVSLVAPGALPGEPKGSGYMTLTFDAKGKIKITGKLADGTAYTGSSLSVMLDSIDDEIVARVPLYACKSTYVFGGWIVLREVDGKIVATIEAPVTDLFWANDDSKATREGVEGFCLDLYPVGGWYSSVFTLQTYYLEKAFSVDLPGAEDDLAELAETLPEGYTFVATPAGEALDLVGNTLSVAKQTLVKDDTKKYTDFAASVNASKVAIKFTRATGIVEGSFDLWYEGTNDKGVREQKSLAGLKHYGVLLDAREDDGFLEDDVWTSGFFLAPVTLSEEVTTLSGTKPVTKIVQRKWTGSYRFDVKAVDCPYNWTEVNP